MFLQPGASSQSAAQDAAPQGPPVTRSGWFSIVTGDPPFPPRQTPGLRPSLAEAQPRFRYSLTDDLGRTIALEFPEAILQRVGRPPRRFHRQRVRVTGIPLEGVPPRVAPPGVPFRALRVQAIGFEDPAREAMREPQPMAAVSGAQPWVTILCRFSDATEVTPAEPSYFQGLMGTVAPGMDHFWRELSYDTMNLTGSTVVGWYNLPQPRSYYVYDQNGDEEPDLDHERAIDDCTTVADADVNFLNFKGINMMFNQDLDCCAWGGSWPLNRDGQLKQYSVTWMPTWGWGNQDVMGHEMGHGFGLPHSSGPYDTPYDSDWDVVSDGGLCSAPDATYGCVAVHTIAYHKDLLGWLASGLKFTATPGTDQVIVLERLAQPVSGTNHRMVQIPIGGSSTNFYTVEARRKQGYDNEIPADAVIIHHVDTTRGDRLARVVDIDNNGNPNDDAARWLVGETFTDAGNGISVEVTAMGTSSFTVRVIVAESAGKRRRFQVISP